ncbi:TetR family transcriptional regulator [Herbihabitans rhizosphaerae]|uniref:TetR family transcriptional regulator n=1 Tax=Herbihabitans rhizosphaerae TaxID=1872711 RepID=A0A4Q7KB07_9PSEU|nr:TetR/AcrR family transcriptional regulator [Herbihabitans rhizosphaerae]RZS29627.1 TetR family transcriptional regulator [Herbihabitans rhizosphaerae]
MPARGDHDARRREVSEAVWRVLAAHGFGGLTMRAVADELGATTGLLTHYFADKRALIAYALDVAEERTDTRKLRTPPADGLPALRAALLDVLVLDKDAATMNRVWVSSWDGALSDPERGAVQKARYRRWRERLLPHVVAAQRLGQLPSTVDADDLVVTAAAFAHGLVVQALFDPRKLPRARQVTLLDNFLAGLAS